MAIDLFQDGRLTLEGLYVVIQDMIYNYGYTPEELMKSFEEIIRRGVLGETAYEKAKEFFISKGLLYPSFEPSMTPLKETKVEDGKVYELEGLHEPWVPDRIDYIHDYR